MDTGANSDLLDSVFLLCSLADDVACSYDFSDKTSSFVLILIPLFNRLQNP